MADLLSRREEVRALRLARSQPESAGELQELLDEIAERTVAAVLADDRVRARLDGARTAVLTTDYREDKAEDAQPARRMAEVGIYDYDSDVLVVAVVDLREGSVVDLDERRGVHPPVSAEELALARELAGADEAIAGPMERAGAGLVAFPSPSYIEGHARAGHRCVTLYWPHRGSVDLNEATIDLSARQVVPDAELMEGSPRARLARQSRPISDTAS